MGKENISLQLFQISHGPHFVCDDQRASFFCNIVTATVQWSGEEQSWMLRRGSAFVVLTRGVSLQC